MKHKRLLLSLGIVLAILLVAALSIGGYFMYQFSRFTIAETGTVAPGIVCIKDDYVNLFLVKTATGYLAIDAGDDIQRVEKSLQSLKIDPLSVRAVLLTHSDKDHVGAVQLFKQATVYLGKEELPCVTGKIPKRLLFFSIHNVIPGNRYRLVSDRERLMIDGIAVDCIHTPGHSVGSYSYLINGALFVGDALVLTDGVAQAMGKPFSADVERNRKTLKEIIAPLPGVSFLATAHAGCTGDIGKALGRK